MAKIKVQAAPQKPPLSAALAAAKAVASAAPKALAGLQAATPVAAAPVYQAPPLLTQAQMSTQAGQQALNAIKPQQQSVIDQQTAAALQARHDEQAIGGINSAASAALASIAPSIQGAYSGAASQIASLAQGFSGQMADTAQQTNQQAQDFATSQGQTPGSLGPNPEQVQNTTYGLQGYVPGSSLAAQGAAASNFGAGIVGAQAATARTEGDARIAQQHTDDLAFQKQLSDIAATYPQLRDAALQALQSYNLQVGTFGLNAAKTTDSITNADAASARAKTLQDYTIDQGTAASQRADLTVSENIRTAEASISHIQKGDVLNAQTVRANLKHLLATDQLSEEAEKRLEAQLNYQISHGQTQDAIDVGNLKLRDKTYQLAVDKAAKAGQQFDRDLSIVVGHAVDENGRDITTSGGGQIPVTAKSFSTAAGATGKTPQARYQQAVGDAKTLRGDPVKNVTGVGLAYIASPGATGSDVNSTVGFPNTTSNPNKAQFDTKYTFAEAQAYLVSRRGLTRARARAALVAAGWKPDGKRPAPKKKTNWITTPGL